MSPSPAGHQLATPPPLQPPPSGAALLTGMHHLRRGEAMPLPPTKPSGMPANQALSLRGTPVHKPETFPAQFLIRNIGLWGGRGMTRGQVAYLLCARPEQALEPKEASHRPLPSKSLGRNSGDADGRLTITGLCPALQPVSPHPPPPTHYTTVLPERKLAPAPPRFPCAEEEAGTGRTPGTAPRSVRVSCAPTL